MKLTINPNNISNEVSSKLLIDFFVCNKVRLFKKYRFPQFAQ